MANCRSVWEYSLRRRKALEVCEGESACGPGDIADFLHKIRLDEEEQEHLLSIVLDSRRRIKGYYTVSVGLIDRTQFHAREVFRTAIALGATQLVLAHNHPSGDPSPSDEDIQCTKQLAYAGEIVGIRIIDHVIIGQPEPCRQKSYLSFQEEGLLVVSK